MSVSLSVDFLLFLGAFVCFALATFGVAIHPRLNLVPLGLALCVLTVFTA